VINSSIPVLGADMPFRIYVEMGNITSAIYDKRLCYDADGKDVISLVDIGREIDERRRPAEADRLILYVEGIDIDAGKQTTTSHSYALGKVKEGKFANIEPRGDGTGFDLREIERWFDGVGPKVVDTKSRSTQIKPA
jgi:hypothetical protein